MTTTPRSWADPTIPAPQASRGRRVLPLVAWMTCLVVAVVLLRVLGAGRLAAPSLADPGSWGAWAAGRDPLEVVMVVLRMVALGLAWYLTGVTSISVVARLLRAARLARVADALSFGPVKILVQQAVGIGLAASVLTTALPAAPGAVRPPTGAAGAGVALLVPTLDTAAASDGTVDDTTDGAALALAAQVAITDSAAEAIVPVPAPAPAPAPSRTASQGEGAPEANATDAAEAPTTPPETITDSTGADSTDAGTADAGTADADADVTDAPTTTSTREVRVEPGDHFWAIAEADVARHLGRSGTDAEVIAHWQAILEANADRLPILGNPDVLHPGQLVVLPPPAEVLT